MGDSRWGGMFLRSGDGIYNQETPDTCQPNQRANLSSLFGLSRKPGVTLQGKVNQGTLQYAGSTLGRNSVTSESNLLDDQDKLTDNLNLHSTDWLKSAANFKTTSSQPKSASASLSSNRSRQPDTLSRRVQPREGSTDRQPQLTREDRWLQPSTTGLLADPPSDAYHQHDPNYRKTQINNNSKYLSRGPERAWRESDEYVIRGRDDFRTGSSIDDRREVWDTRKSILDPRAIAETAADNSYSHGKRNSNIAEIEDLKKAIDEIYSRMNTRSSNQNRNSEADSHRKVNGLELDPIYSDPLKSNIRDLEKYCDQKTAECVSLKFQLEKALADNKLLSAELQLANDRISDLDSQVSIFVKGALDSLCNNNKVSDFNYLDRRDKTSRTDQQSRTFQDHEQSRLGRESFVIQARHQGKYINRDSRGNIKRQFVSSSESEEEESQSSNSLSRQNNNTKPNENRFDRQEDKNSNKTNPQKEDFSPQFYKVDDKLINKSKSQNKNNLAVDPRHNIFRVSVSVPEPSDVPSSVGEFVLSPPAQDQSSVVPSEEDGRGLGLMEERFVNQVNQLGGLQAAPEQTGNENSENMWLLGPLMQAMDHQIHGLTDNINRIKYNNFNISVHPGTGVGNPRGQNNVHPAGSVATEKLSPLLSTEQISPSEICPQSPPPPPQGPPSLKSEESEDSNFKTSLSSSVAGSDDTGNPKESSLKYFGEIVNNGLILMPEESAMTNVITSNRNIEIFRSNPFDIQLSPTGLDTLSSQITFSPADEPRSGTERRKHEFAKSGSPANSNILNTEGLKFYEAEDEDQAEERPPAFPDEQVSNGAVSQEEVPSTNDCVIEDVERQPRLSFDNNKDEQTTTTTEGGRQIDQIPFYNQTEGKWKRQMKTESERRTTADHSEVLNSNSKIINTAGAIEIRKIKRATGTGFFNMLIKNEDTVSDDGQTINENKINENNESIILNNNEIIDRNNYKDRNSSHGDASPQKHSLSSPMSGIINETNLLNSKKMNVKKRLYQKGRIEREQTPPILKDE